MNAASQVIYEFGPFRIDPDRETLLRDGQPLAITPKAFEVLLALVRRSHEVVAKDELMQAVWPGRVVEEANLSQCIFLLRKLLGDTPDLRRYIVTLPGKGYRFAAPVRTVTSGEPDADAPVLQNPPDVDAAVTGQPAEPRTRSTARKLVFTGIGVLIVAVLSLGTTYVIKRGAPTPATAGIPAKSIAVLPFENLSNDKNNAYFVAGMQGLILTKLADIEDLKVISRTSTEQYASHPDNLKQIAQQLGVATILEGSVQKAGNQVLIDVQLIDADTDAHIWAESYTRTLDNIFGVEGEVAGKVAQALDAKLTASEIAAVAHVPTTNPQAYDDYLRALYFYNEASKGDWMTFFPQAIAAAKKAVAEDPDFALAWAELSNGRIAAYYWGGDRSQANLRAAEAAAKRALALAPKLPEAHLAMADIERFVHHDLVAAHNQIQQAVDLRPDDAGALASLAISDSNLGDWDAALKASRRAIALDPTNSFYEFEYGYGLASGGHYAAARQAEQRALAIDPLNALAYLAMGQIDIAQNGDVDAATKVLDDMASDTPVNVQIASMRIDFLLYRRQFAAARALAEQYSEKFTSGDSAITITLARANIEWLAGKTDRARALYRTAVDLINPSGTGITVSDDLELGLAYARLGDADAAMKQFAAAIKPGRSQIVSNRPIPKYALAKAELALGRKSAAIDTLAQFAALETHDQTVWSVTPALLRIDPTWDPIRHDPAFQAMLEKYDHEASAGTLAPASASSGVAHG